MLSQTTLLRVLVSLVLAGLVAIIALAGALMYHQKESKEILTTIGYEGE